MPGLCHPRISSACSAQCETRPAGGELRWGGDGGQRSRVGVALWPDCALTPPFSLPRDQHADAPSARSPSDRSPPQAPRALQVVHSVSTRALHSQLAGPNTPHCALGDSGGEKKWKRTPRVPLSASARTSALPLGREGSCRAPDKVSAALRAACGLVELRFRGHVGVSACGFVGLSARGLASLPRCRFAGSRVGRLIGLQVCTSAGLVVRRLACLPAARGAACSPRRSGRVQRSSDRAPTGEASCARCIRFG
jgi:hypothetical protein